MPQPPKGVVQVMNAVLILLQQKPNWDTAKKIMAQSGFISSLKDFDKDNIPDKIIRKLKKDFISDEQFSNILFNGFQNGSLRLFNVFLMLVIPKYIDSHCTVSVFERQKLCRGLVRLQRLFVNGCMRW